MALGLGLYIAARDYRRRRRPDRTWDGWSGEALRGWGGYFRFALPSVAMICCEWWVRPCCSIQYGPCYSMLCMLYCPAL